MPSSRITALNRFCYAVRDLYPDTPLHTLIIPKRHVGDFFDLRQPERQAIYGLMKGERTRLQAMDHSVSGFNLAINCGRDAGQTVMHCHVHLVPRRRGDDAQLNCSLPGLVPNMHLVRRSR